MYMYMYIRVFDKLIWRTTGPKTLALHSSLFEPYGTVNVEYTCVLSLTALTLCYLAQDVHVSPMVHTLTIVELIWSMLQNISKTLMYIITCTCTCIL